MATDYHINQLNDEDKESLLKGQYDKRTDQEKQLKLGDTCSQQSDVINNVLAVKMGEKTPDEKPKDDDGGVFDIFNQFDRSFLFIMIICNFAQGFKCFLDLSLLNLYKEVMKLEPAEVQAFIGVIAIPWSFKIIYGFASDNLQVFNSKRRGHLLMNTMCCILSMAAIIVFGVQFGKYFVTVCVFITQINMAYCDTVTDALTVQATKKGVKNGSENLNSVSYLF